MNGSRDHRLEERHSQSYSARDSVHSATTLNLGKSLEAATDQLAQAFACKLAEHMSYQPALGAVIEDDLYRDCAGQLTARDLIRFREIERGQAEADLSLVCKKYLRSMRLFTQHVTRRYHAFLEASRNAQRDELHALILQAMISGNLKALQGFLNMQRGEMATRSFATLFKTPVY